MPVLGVRLNVDPQKEKEAKEKLAELERLYYQIPNAISLLSVIANGNTIASLGDYVKNIGLVVNHFSQKSPFLSTFEEINTKNNLLTDNHFLPDLSNISPEVLQTKEEKILLDTNKILSKIEKNSSNNSKRYGFDTINKTFFAIVPNIVSINFNSKRGENNMALLFEVMWQALNERGVMDGEYKKVAISRAEIIKNLTNKNKQNVDNKWIKSTRSNLTSKINSSSQNLFIISEYDSSIKGYWFKFRIPLNINP